MYYLSNPSVKNLREKPRAFDPRERVVLTPSDKIALTLRVEIKMAPEKRLLFRGFL